MRRTPCLPTASDRHPTRKAWCRCRSSAVADPAIGRRGTAHSESQPTHRHSTDCPQICPPQDLFKIASCPAPGVRRTLEVKRPSVGSTVIVECRTPTPAPRSRRPRAGLFAANGRAPRRGLDTGPSYHGRPNEASSRPLHRSPSMRESGRTARSSGAEPGNRFESSNWGDHRTRHSAETLPIVCTHYQRLPRRLPSEPVPAP
jgi:hypothetical protein